ncbi:MAG: thiamine-phosphate kinase [Candidatus Eremiobacteraeota bacterium]|nr:thiamine-phosphate kinase [Candidatus Eremiobacteraeota bacterium]
MPTLNVLTEDDLIAAIALELGSAPRRLRAGIGDDAALWKTPRAHLNVITTDMLVDGVHFRLASTTPGALGHKALAVNLSDIAAMGASPQIAVVALGITDVVDEPWARAFYRGMADLARRHGCAIAGGDIARTPALTIAVTACGDVRRSDVRLRSGARPGDVACVTGPLGLAAGWLRHVQMHGDEAAAADAVTGNDGAGLVADDALRLRAAYETPSPRVTEGAFLGGASATHALMDISDGVSLDGARMARASGVDLVLELGTFRRWCEERPLRAFGSSALDLVLHGGDDYELLAAVDGRAYHHLAKRFRARFQTALAQIGRFERGSGEVWVEDQGVRSAHTPRGYDHLARTR